MHKSIGAIVASLALAFYTSAGLAQVRVIKRELPQRAPLQTPATPSAHFDPEAAILALMPGTSTIVGRTCHKAARLDQTTFPDRSRVHLLPMTPHLEEWLALKQAPGADVAPLDHRVFAARVEAEADHTGRFTLPGLQPGRYLLIASTRVERVRMGHTPIASIHGPDGWTDYLQSKQERSDFTVHLERVVEIKRPGQTVTVSLNDGKRWGETRRDRKCLP